MRDHIKILGWLYVAGGALMLLVGFVFGSLFGLASVLTETGEDAVILGGVGAAFALFISLLGLPSLICGWGLLTFKRWSRMFGIILSVLQVANFPFGTLMGGYGLWVLLNDDARHLLESGGRVPQVRGQW